MHTFLQPASEQQAWAWHFGPAIVDDVPGLQQAAQQRILPAPQPRFDIHRADTDAGLRSASMLVNRLYGERGYGQGHQLVAHPDRLTLAASASGRMLGTVTLGRDAPGGLLADEVFKAEMDAHRARGARICEVTKLGIDPGAHSQMALASLFHVLYLYAHRVYRCTDVFIEVHPRHRRFYENMLGFQEAAERRANPRVNAPAHLLRASLEHMGHQIDRLGGTGMAVGSERSLYPYFFSSSDAGRIIQRMLELD